MTRNEKFLKLPGSLPGHNIELYVPNEMPSGGGHLPVVYLLHGIGDTETDWWNGNKGNLENLLQELSGDLLPMAFVMPLGFLDQKKIGKEFPNSALFVKHITETVIPAVEAACPVGGSAEKRAIVGISMGGKQALEIGLRHPDLFSSIGALSPAIQNMNVTAELDAAKQAGVNGLVYVRCGRRDQHQLYPFSEKLLNELAKREIQRDPLAADQLDWPDDPTEKNDRHRHNWLFWRRALADLLPKLSKRFYDHQSKTAPAA